MAAAKKVTEQEAPEEIETQFLSRGEQGQIQIGDDVIARIVAIAATEVDGVCLENKFSIRDLIGRAEKEQVKGINVERDPERASIMVTVSVRMEYGRDMYELAVQLRSHIKATVEKMTHVAVDKVDVRIVGINVPEKDKVEGAAADDEEV